MRKTSRCRGTRMATSPSLRRRPRRASPCRSGPTASPNAGKLTAVQGVWAAHCQFVGDGGRRVLLAGLGEGDGSLALARFGTRAPCEQRLAPDLVENVAEQPAAGWLADAADQGAQDDGEGDPVGIARFLAGPVLGGPARNRAIPSGFLERRICWRPRR